MAQAEDVEGLLDALRHEEPDVRERAAKALGKLDDPRAVEPLMAVAADLDSDSVLAAQAAIEAIGELGDARALPALEQALENDESLVRSAAVEVLGDLGDPAALPALERALGDRKGSVREDAMRAIGKVGGGRALELVEAALHDAEASRGLQRAAVAALADMGDFNRLHEVYRSGYVRRRVKEYVQDEVAKRFRIRRGVGFGPGLGED